MKKFYDIHMHAFDLSHPNIAAFLWKFDFINKCIDRKTFKIKWWFVLWLALLELLKLPILVKKIFCKGEDKPIFKKVIDTISFFEIPHEYQFLVMDYHLKNKKNKKLSINEDNNLILGENTYKKIVLCPLIIDFGYKDISRLEHNFSPKRPIAKQTSDMFYAIRTYFRFEIDVKESPKGGSLFELSEENKKWFAEREKKLFEIYPFMGIDTENYSLFDLKKLLDKYFKDFNNTKDAKDRQTALRAKMGMFDSNLYRDKNHLKEEEKDYLDKKNISHDYQHAFAGIKLYPQLGFDPYPDGETKVAAINDIQNLIEKEQYSEEECKALDTPLNRVCFLYQYCIDKRIPITTHCSDGGYKTGDNDKLTSPLTKWKKVLNDYPDLTLNFAHFGHQADKKREWRDEIIRLAEKYPNIYTDISCNDMSEKYYKDLKDDLKKNPHLQNKVLFGSDFSINMLVTKTDSYDDNLSKFAESELEYQDLLCNHNSERFLFGGKIEE